MNPIVCLAVMLSLATPAAAQAPQSADKWRGTTASRGATASLGATTGPAPGTLRAGIQVLHTPDAVGLTSILGGLDGIKRVGPTYRFALDVDLAR